MKRLILILAVFALFSGAGGLPGCGQKSSSSKKKKKKRGKKKGSKKKKESALADPTAPPKVKQGEKDLIIRLGALDEEHWGPAMEQIRNMKSSATGPLCWGMKYPLQNLRSRCLEVLSEMKLHPDIIRGALNALKVYNTNISKYEMPMRRWAMRVLARFHKYSVYTEQYVRRAAEMDHDPGVRVLAGYAMCLMGIKDGMSVMIRELRPIPWKTLKAEVEVYNDVSNEDAVRIDAMKKIKAFVQKYDLKGKPTVLLVIAPEVQQRYEEAGAMAREFITEVGGPGDRSQADLASWWKSARNSLKFKVKSFSNDPMPVKVPVQKWEPPKVTLMPMELGNIESDLEEAEELIGQGEVRRASGVLRRAFKESRNTRMDIYYRHFDLRRTLGPDHADKCYVEIKEKVIAWDPLNIKFRMLAAQCAIDFQGWNEAIDMYKMILILDPDNDEAKAGIEDCEAKKKGG
jgi:hypothetical protein